MFCKTPESVESNFSGSIDFSSANFKITYKKYCVLARFPQPVSLLTMTSKTFLSLVGSIPETTNGSLLIKITLINFIDTTEGYWAQLLKSKQV